MKKIKPFIVAGLLLLGLIFIRAFQNPLFYDPMIEFFKGNYLNNPLPEIDKLQYFLNLLLRYTLNTTLSLGIIYILFRDIRILIFSVKFYFILLIILVFALLLLFEMFEYKMLFFYVRRFIIQPLFLFILVPAFYYQKLKKE
mgnify:CR=1 FL=1